MSVVTLLMVALLVPTAQGVVRHDTGKGILYVLGVTQDVWIESGSNYNSYEYLTVSKLPQYPNKRSLVQFEDLPSNCSSSQIQLAYMYLYYVYAHKASGQSITFAPFIRRYLEVHLVKKAWNESQATSTVRLSGVSWSSAWLGLDGTDADTTPQPGKVTIFPYRPAGFVAFDIIDAVNSWRRGVVNNGLVIRATNELDPGRTIRFASNAMSDSSKHAFVHVLCAPEGKNGFSPATSSTTADKTNIKLATSYQQHVTSSASHYTATPYQQQACSCATSGSKDSVTTAQSTFGSIIGVASGQSTSGSKDGVTTGQSTSSSIIGVKTGQSTSGSKNSVTTGQSTSSSKNSVATGQSTSGSIIGVTTGQSTSGSKTTKPTWQPTSSGKTCKQTKQSTFSSKVGKPT